MALEEISESISSQRSTQREGEEEVGEEEVGEEEVGDGGRLEHTLFLRQNLPFASNRF